MTETRRALMQMIGIAPIAAVSAKAELAAIMGQDIVGTAANTWSNGAQTTGQIGGGVNPLQMKFGKDMAEKIFGLQRRLQAEADQRATLRHCNGGLDVDIAAFKSISATYKHRKQIERNLEDHSLGEKIQQFMRGN